MPPKKNIIIETITLNAGHALILSHRPDKLGMSQINKKLEEQPQEVGQFGLFDRAAPNYTTYYPEVSAEDLNPSDSEFIEPVFRMLSNVSVHAQYNPIYFPASVLKASMSKLIGQTVNIDHEMAVGNAVGTVKNVEWQNAYTSNGIKIPAGINATLKIDGKSNPRIARGIMMDPPSIHSNSVTVNFAWEKSHPKMEDNEFYNSLGTFDDKGKLIQKIATEIKAYHETSLVSHGADPFAQKVDGNGKIVNPSYAGDRYPLSEDNFSWDWKNLEKSEHEEVILNSLKNPNTNNNIQNLENMKDLFKFLETFFGLEAESLTEDNYKTTLGDIDFLALKAKAEAPVKILDLEGLEAIENEVTTLRAFKEEVPDNLSEQIQLAETGKVAIVELKADTVRLYKLTVKEGEEDVNILGLIEASDYKTLQSLHAQYDKATEGQFNFTCSKCGSTDVTRASANPSTEGGENQSKTSSEVIDKFTSGSEVNIPGFKK